MGQPLSQIQPFGNLEEMRDYTNRRIHVFYSCHIHLNLLGEYRKQSECVIPVSTPTPPPPTSFISTKFSYHLVFLYQTIAETHQINVLQSTTVEGGGGGG